MSKFYNACGNKKRLSVIAGPCVFETQEHALHMAGALSEICKKHNVNFIYKTSFDKANRSKYDSFRSAGFDAAHYGMQAVRDRGIEVLTDIHEAWHADAVAADILQIPAFLCRQTDLINAAVDSGKPVNIKKGQFLAPWDMVSVVVKAEERTKHMIAGVPLIMLTERGTTFGYNNLVVDMRSLVCMRDHPDMEAYPVIMDCTHAVQLPGKGGEHQYIAPIARAAVSVGIAGVFLEVHETPDTAPSDGPNMLPLKDFEPLLERLLKIDDVVKR